MYQNYWHPEIRWINNNKKKVAIVNKEDSKDSNMQLASFRILPLDHQNCLEQMQSKTLFL